MRVVPVVPVVLVVLVVLAVLVALVGLVGLVLLVLPVLLALLALLVLQSNRNTHWSLLLGFIISDLQDLLLPRFSGPSRGSQKLSWQRERGESLGDPPRP